MEPVSGAQQAVRALARRALFVAMAVLVGLVVQARADGAGPDDPGEPCRSVHQYPVTFVEDAGGGVEGVFAFAGGAFQGRRPLSADDARLISSHDAYVTDVQLGTYEPTDLNQPGSPLVCRLDPSFHFFCPATGGLDQLCFTWVARRVGDHRSPEA